MKKLSNRRKAVKLSLLAASVFVTVWGFSNFTSTLANDETEIKLRNASRVTNTSPFAIQDAKANQSPEAAETVNCGEAGSDCTVTYNEGSRKVEGKREVEQAY
ncbi:hypothetical protein SAMN05660226_04188 [Parapedobacter luteus]|uniref:Uncharacterized protein n=1 Tax=Parapedobacter luteus TaxID=623280 RepID=A0A1T5FU68_9SPHI|nr:hypothetical protein [Parapedobacter luteus]SKB99715.1 hypothetical protein SAMN05660226_04188 [Parapedobacter luteus]